MTFCESLPACRRGQCGMPACEHQSAEPHIIVGMCDGYVYPENWGVCMNCQELSTVHSEADPHDTNSCLGFEYAPGISASMFVGGGGRFGGGGATGSW